MGRFGANPQAFFDSVYEGAAPWDIGGPQPDMVSLLTDLPPLDPILDVGCGSGDLSVYLARLGHQVVGIDFVQRAIDQANRKRASLPAAIARMLTFRVANAARPAAMDGRYGAVIDSGFLHLLEPDESTDYLADVATVLTSPGRLFLHEFAVEFPIANAPRAVTDAELRARFMAPGWRILEIRSGQFHSAVAPPVPAILACVERVDGLPAPHA